MADHLLARHRAFLNRLSQVFLLAVLVLSAACGGGDSGPPPTNPPQPPPSPVAVSVGRVWERELPPDFIGVNEDAHLVTKGDPWSDTALTDAFASLRPGTLRYGGGSQGNYWNWREGRCDTAIDYRRVLVPWWFAGYVDGQKSHTLDNLKIGVEAAGAGVVFMLNVVTDNEGSRCGTPAYQVAMLRDWRERLAMPLRYVELGNEVPACWQEGLICLPTGSSNADPDATPKYQRVPADYTDDMARWITEIRRQVPGEYDIALAGAASPIPQLYGREIAWNRDLDAHVADLFGPARADAITIHHYYETGTQRPGATPLGEFVAKGLDSWHWSLDRSLLAYLESPRWDDVDIWVTEFNLDGDGTGNYYDTWDQCLYLMAVLSEMLENDRITLTSYHGAYGGLFGAITTANRLTRPGYLLQLWGEASHGMTRAEQYAVLSGALPPLDAGGAYPALLAWVFTDGTTRRAIVANLTSQPVALDPSGLEVSRASYRAMTAADIPGVTQTFTGAIMLPPYSVTLIGGE